MNDIKKIPRIMFAGTNSGCGKTTVVCGILWALKHAGLKCSSVKCGPDYIDPMFHSQIFDIPSQNLDLFFSSKEQVRYLMAQNASSTDITVMEGVMGYYDGLAMDSVKASSFDLAYNTDTPVILIVNAKGMGLSVVPVIQGFLNFDFHNTGIDNNCIKGVILNGISDMTAKQLTPVIEQLTHIKVIGSIPYVKDCCFEGRHLGLVTPFEQDNIRKNIEKIGHVISEHIDLKEIIKIADSASPIDTRLPQEWENKIMCEQQIQKLRVAVAYDKAFCFYYKDNMELLKKLGCELVFFSPLNDKELPKGTDIILLGGGYPEVYAKELSENYHMLDDIRRAINSGIFYIAECGGFMYLHEQLEDEHGKVYNMAGIIKGKCFNTHKLTRFGYIYLKKSHVPDETYNALTDDAITIKGHEFHYWDSTNNGSSYIAVKPSGKRSWECIHANDNGIAGYPHLYYYSDIDFINEFLIKCRRSRYQCD